MARVTALGLPHTGENEGERAHSARAPMRIRTIAMIDTVAALADRFAGQTAPGFAAGWDQLVRLWELIVLVVRFLWGLLRFLGGG